MNERQQSNAQWCAEHGVMMSPPSVDEFLAKLKAHLVGAMRAGEEDVSIPVILHGIEGTDLYAVTILGEMIAEGPDKEEVEAVAYSLIEYGVRTLDDTHVDPYVARDVPPNALACRGCGGGFATVNCSKKDTPLCPYWAMEQNWDDSDGPTTEEGES